MLVRKEYNCMNLDTEDSENEHEKLFLLHIAHKLSHGTFYRSLSIVTTA